MLVNGVFLNVFGGHQNKFDGAAPPKPTFCECDVFIFVIAQMWDMQNITWISLKTLIDPKMFPYMKAKHCINNMIFINLLVKIW